MNIHERATKPTCRPVFAHTWGWRTFDITDGEVERRTLALMNDTFLPDIQPKRIFPTRKQRVVPPLSYAFFVIAQANAKACQVGGQAAGYINDLGRQSLEDELYKA